MDILTKLSGYKTYIGIAVTIIGMSGVSKYITPDQVSVILNGLFDIIGILITIIGAIHKDIKIENLKEELE